MPRRKQARAVATPLDDIRPEAAGLVPAEQAELAVQSARKISKVRLLGGLRALQRADDRLKGGKDARTVLEFLVSELTAPDAQAARG